PDVLTLASHTTNGNNQPPPPPAQPPRSSRRDEAVLTQAGGQHWASYHHPTNWGPGPTPPTRNPR
ncbi:MAG: hypothetical protein M3Z25_17775, partial [Actinomycetota bacterium]|nr:hypothetical protein [Actinomycetota bacterium]